MPIEHLVGWAPYPPSQKPRTVRHRLPVRFILNDRVEGPFNTIIEYPIDVPGPIEGWVVEDASTVDQLMFGAMINLDGALEQAGHHLSITSHSVGIHQWYRGALGSTGVVCHFGCSELTIEERYERHAEGQTSAARSAAFSLTGPTELWEIYRSDPFSRNPPIEPGYKNTTIDLGPDFGINCEIRPQVVWEERDGPTTSFTYAWKLTLAESDDARADTDDDFLRTATALTHDLLLLMSFLNHSWIRWYARATKTGSGYGSLINRQSDVGPISNASIDHEANPVGAGKARDFVRTAMPALREARAAGFDLEPAITHVIESDRRDVFAVHQRFASAFMALESLVRLYARHAGLATNTSERDFKKRIRPAVSRALDKLQMEGRLRERIREKVPELNRPSFRAIFTSMLEHYAVRWDDLYPDGHKLEMPAFIRIRDEAFHASEAEDRTKRLELERVRVQTVADRVILRALGWPDSGRTPRGLWFSILRRYWGDEPDA